MSQEFIQESPNYWKQLPAAFGGAKLVVELPDGNTAEPDWQLIAEFEAFVLREGPALRTRVHEPLKMLATQTGWFTADEVATAFFEWSEVVLLYEASALAAKRGAGMVYELHFSMESYGAAWVDIYGNWVAAFEGLALVGLRRENS